MPPERTARPSPDGPSAGGRKSARTRERILAAAAQILSGQGWAGTRLADIAEVAAVQAPAVYYYWPSREELLAEVVTVGQQATHAHVVASLEALPGDAGAFDRIDRAIAAHLEVVLDRSDFALAAIRNAAQLPLDIRERQLVGQRDYADVWRGLVEDAVAAGELAADVDARAARMLVLGALNWAPEWWHPDRGSLDEVVATTQHVVRSGLGRSRATPR
ncbi:TetR family transcriptional regulator [Actinomycetospora sp. NBRC 106375]|uniref:TetR/AcrR family transcriptional regulator n=1 Tax=Actinomycetospora sp. NBRC 106375 TaxID=3032207 RepID=UPI0024A0560A|nr:TetR/AcrR family transcriptional regulator [Actinomycetospora sp. NBRC 106375]GLZ49700.1 TetR family transcriptional regulator [Actinomycetospora sp. NBRC 106375]